MLFPVKYRSSRAFRSGPFAFDFLRSSSSIAVSTQQFPIINYSRQYYPIIRDKFRVKGKSQTFKYPFAENVRVFSVKRIEQRSRTSKRIRNGGNFRDCLPTAETRPHPAGTHASSRANEVAVARQIDYVLAEGFPRGLSRVAAPRTCHSRSHPSCVALVSKNCTALARDPLSIPLLNLRPYYRMPRKGAPPVDGGTDIEIQLASEPSKRRRRATAIPRRERLTRISRNNSLIARR